MRMVGTECIRNILFILPLGAEWWNGVLSIPEYECGIKERAHFTFMAILIPELWIKKRALSLKKHFLLKRFISQHS